jgi:hypothetical protein
MLQNPTTAQLRALHALTRSAHWKDFISIFETDLELLNGHLAQRSDEVALRQLQGKAQYVRAFLGQVDKLHETLEKLGETVL